MSYPSPFLTSEPHLAVELYEQEVRNHAALIAQTGIPADAQLAYKQACWKAAAALREAATIIKPYVAVQKLPRREMTVAEAFTIGVWVGGIGAILLKIGG